MTANRLFSARPIVAPENSLLLRVLIQLMVSIGIIATDVAADTQMSLWAVPLSLVGATWSWRQRERPQVGIKFALAAALLVALFYFFQNLLANLNDTRIILAELLVQVQAIHTFDMPRRKDLGYSIIIGVILISVAATIGQTMVFAPMLLVFLALALPVMVLDYRSRLKLPVLEIQRATFQGQAAALPVKSLGKLFATAVALGLIVFAVMPRLPSYQVQSMPMSGSLPISSTFDASKIVNPGYQSRSKGGQSGQGSGQGNGDEQQEDPNAFDDSNYYGFNQSMNQNVRGVLKPKLVMRVRSQSPGFWRVLGFDRYTGQGWVVSKNDEAKKVQRPSWSNKFILPNPTYPKSRRIVQSYTTVAELPNVLPALTTPDELYFPTPEMAVDREGSLRAPGSLVPNFTYTVISQVPERDPTTLTKAGENYKASSVRKDLADYLQIPETLAAKLRPFTEKLVADYPLSQVSRETTPLDNNYDKALYLAQYLKQNYQIPQDLVNLPQLPASADLAEWFLFRCQGKGIKGECIAGGYPDHFATVHTLMLRSIGIPARLAVGFDPGYFNPFTGMYEVKNTDAHALTEVYFPKYGWFAFDPIPGHPLLPPSVEDSQVFGVVKQLWNWVAGLLPVPVTAWLAWVIGGILSLLIAVWVFCTQGWFGAICGLAGVVVLSYGGWMLWRSWRRWRYGRWLRQQPPMEQVYQQMLGMLQRRELPVRQVHETPLEHWHGLDGSVKIVVEPIVLAYVAWRYGGEPQNVNYLRSILLTISTVR